MIAIMEQSGKTSAYVTGFVVDTEADIADLPSLKNVAPGSWCLVIDTSEVYMLNNEGEWKIL